MCHDLLSVGAVIALFSLYKKCNVYKCQEWRCFICEMVANYCVFFRFIALTLVVVRWYLMYTCKGVQ